MVMAPLLLPEAVGAKTSEIEQSVVVDPAVNTAGQLLVPVKSPDTSMLEICTFVVP